MIGELWAVGEHGDDDPGYMEPDHVREIGRTWALRSSAEARVIARLAEDWLLTRGHRPIFSAAEEATDGDGR